jgi:hypothetical protein
VVQLLHYYNPFSVIIDKLLQHRNMAKGLRSSVKKANRSKLRSRVFGPVEDARTQRLSAKLLELATQPKPSKPLDARMDVEETGEWGQKPYRHGS